MSWTISSEVLPIFTLTWQPVSFSNGVTQSVSASLEPSSAYPAQVIRLSSPSPSPTEASGSSLGGSLPSPPDD